MDIDSLIFCKTHIFGTKKALAILRSLVIQTGIYGLSSILGRLVNYLLVPLYSRVFLPSEAAVYVEMYAYMAFLIVLLTYGMETAFFRRYQIAEIQQKTIVFGTSFLSIVITSAIFIVGCVLFSKQLSILLRYPEHPEYVIYVALILGFDAMSAIPFAQLRADNKAFLFALVRLFNISINIAGNLLFILVFPGLYQNVHDGFVRELLSVVTNGDAQVSAIFVANLIASVVTFGLLLIVVKPVRLHIDFLLWKQMLRYGFPLLILGLAGMVNETIDRILLKYLLPADIAMHVVGIYGMCFKMAVFISIFIQAFRYAAEPFFFARANDKNAPEIYARVMHYFVIAGLGVFLMVTLFMDYFKFFVGPQYHEGIKVVPILLISHLFLGVYFNLSVWYKITDRTQYGAYISLTGMVVSIGLNILLIPVFSYVGSAWANFVSYLVMMTLSYLIGKRYYSIPYNLLGAALYFIVALVLYSLSIYIIFPLPALQLIWNTFLFGLYWLLVIVREKELQNFILKFRR